MEDIYNYVCDTIWSGVTANIVYALLTGLVGYVAGRWRANGQFNRELKKSLAGVTTILEDFGSPTKQVPSNLKMVEKLEIHYRTHISNYTDFKKLTYDKDLEDLISLGRQLKSCNDQDPTDHKELNKLNNEFIEKAEGVQNAWDAKVDSMKNIRYHIKKTS